MKAYAERHVVLTASFGPFGKNVALWTDGLRVPFLIFAVPEVKVVVVVAECEEIARTNLFI